MAVPLITKTYLCEVVENLETPKPGYTIRQRRWNVQILSLPGQTSVDPTSKGIPVEQPTNVAVTTSQAGHDIISHFGFEEVT